MLLSSKIKEVSHFDNRKNVRRGEGRFSPVPENIPVFGRKNPGVRQMNKWVPALIYVLAMGLAVFMAGAEDRGIVLALEIVFSVPIGPVLIPRITIGG